MQHSLDYLKAVLLGPLRYTLIFGNIVESAKSGFDYKASPIEEIPNKLSRGIKEVLQGDILDSLWNFAQVGSMMEGLPINQPKRTFTGLNDLMSGKTDDWRRLIWSKYSLGYMKKKKGNEVENFIDKELSKDEEYITLDENQQKKLRNKIKEILEKKGITDKKIKIIQDKKEEIYQTYLKKLEKNEEYIDSSEDLKKKFKSQLRSEINKEYNIADLLYQ